VADEPQTFGKQPVGVVIAWSDGKVSTALV